MVKIVRSKIFRGVYVFICLCVIGWRGFLGKDIEYLVFSKGIFYFLG